MHAPTPEDDLTETAGERRRRHPRCAVALDVSLEGLPATTTNISIGGAQVACSTSSPELLASYLESQTVRGVFVLPGGGTFAVSCRVIYALCRDGECLLGLEFHRFERDALGVLRAFIARRAGPENAGHGTPEASAGAGAHRGKTPPNSDQIDNL